jgi:hypothetical protein
MKISYYGDRTIDIDFAALARGLNEISGGVQFHTGTGVAQIPGRTIRNPDTYNEFELPDDNILEDRDLALISTTKAYDNNYFYDFPDRIGIISFSGWEHLTSLPIINGLVYFTAELLCDSIPVGESHEENTGCLNDFLWNKTGVDIGMRSAFICPKCRRDFETKKACEEETQIFKTIELLLDHVCLASRSGQSLLDYWGASTKSGKRFDTFLCHNSQDKDAIRELNTHLKENGVITWLDEEQLPPGRPWQDELERQIPSIKSAVIAVGQSGIGPWQNVEIRAFLSEFVRRGCPVIPLILPECKDIPDLPLFLRQFTWVDLRKARPDPFKLLLWGVTGKRQ